MTGKKKVTLPQTKAVDKCCVSCLQDGANGTADQGAPNPTGEGTKTAKRQKKKQEKDAANLAEKQRQAQLELLLMDDKALQDAVKLGKAVYLCPNTASMPLTPVNWNWGWLYIGGKNTLSL